MGLKVSVGGVKIEYDSLLTLEQKSDDIKRINHMDHVQIESDKEINQGIMILRDIVDNENITSSSLSSSHYHHHHHNYHHNYNQLNSKKHNQKNKNTTNNNHHDDNTSSDYHHHSDVEIYCINTRKNSKYNQVSLVNKCDPEFGFHLSSSIINPVTCEEVCPSCGIVLQSNRCPLNDQDPEYEALSRTQGLRHDEFKKMQQRKGMIIGNGENGDGEINELTTLNNNSDNVDHDNDDSYYNDDHNGGGGCELLLLPLSSSSSSNHNHSSENHHHHYHSDINTSSLSLSKKYNNYYSNNHSDSDGGLLSSYVWGDCMTSKEKNRAEKIKQTQKRISCIQQKRKTQLPNKKVKKADIQLELKLRSKLQKLKSDQLRAINNNQRKNC
jgi:hypothetical protein